MVTRPPDAVDGAALRSWRMEIGAIPPESLRGNSTVHPRYRGRYKKWWRDSGYWHVCQDMPDCQPVGKLRLTFRWYHNIKIDEDNLLAGMKSWIDGFALGVKRWQPDFDDDPDHVTYGEHLFVKCRKGDSRTEVLIEELAARQPQEASE